MQPDDAIALQFGGLHLSYAELEVRTNQLAGYLAKAGIGCGQIIALGLGRSPNMLIALLAVLKTGASYLPIDPSFPPLRISHMLEDSGAQWVITERASEDAFPTDSIQQIRLDDDSEVISAFPATFTGHRSNQTDCAYLIYTSGSTGLPKGVRISHAACINLLQSMSRLPGFTKNDRLVAVTTLSFDIAFLELILPLVNGGRIILSDRATASNGLALKQLLIDSKANVMQATPATWRLLVEAGWTGHADFKILCGGESLSPALATELLPRCGELWNLYGPTEATIWSTVDQVRDSDISIGRPIDHTTIYLLDDHDRPVTGGEIGELCIGGAGLAIDYYQQPKLTAEKFFQLRLADGSYEKVYRTGDLARWREDGKIDCLGRIDQQVKLRGFRIELGEIESAMRMIDGITESVAILHESPDGEKNIAAFFTGDHSPVSEKIREELSASLPTYMLPSSFTKLDRMPLTPNGKINRKAMPEPGQWDFKTFPVLSQESQDPITQKVAAIFGEVLGNHSIDPRQNFFHLGGHSLTAMRAINRINQALGIHLTTDALFRNPSVEQMIRAIADQSPSHAASLIHQPGTRLTLSRAQQGLLMLEKSHPNETDYNLTEGRRIHGLLDLKKLESAIARIIDRHDILRLIIPEQGPALQQKPFCLEFHDLSLEQEDAQSFELRRIAKETAAFVFDLENGPLFRAIIFKMGELDHALLVSFHHIISDQWSIDVFMQELDFYYQHGNQDPQPMAIQFNDFAIWDNQRDHHAAREYWRQELSDAPPFCELPLDHLPTNGRRRSESMVELQLPRHLLVELGNFCQRESITRFTTLLSAFAALLARWTGKDDIVIGTPTANRTLTEFEPLIGYFANMIPVRIQTSGDENFSDLTKLTSTKVAAAIQHQSISFPELVQCINPPRKADRHPIFQVAFVLHQETTNPKIGDLSIEPFYPQPSGVKFDLTLRLIDSTDSITAYLDYDPGRFTKSTIQRLGEQFTALLSDLLVESSKPGKDVRIGIPPAEFPPCLIPYPRQESLSTLFLEVANAHPNSPAILHEGNTWTYRELLDASWKIASDLREHGAKQGDFIAITGGSSFQWIASMIGILHTGAAYVPIDPSLPVNRKQFILEHADIRIILHAGSTESESFSPDRINIDSESVIRRESAVEFPVHADGESPAYLLYTSGTTGSPKGVVIPQRAVTRLVRQQQYVEISKTDVFLQTASLSFDAATFEIWGALLNGAKLVLSPPSSNLDTLAQSIHSEQISILWLTAGLFQLMIEHHPEKLINVRYLISGGDIMSPRHARLAIKTLPHTKLINGYGPTENTTFSTSHHVTESDLTRPTIPIGKPIANTTGYILDQELRPVAIGMPGELYLAGDGLAIGYHKNPELTLSSFIQYPDLGRIYRTGDRCRYLMDGSILLIGRIDSQIKIRGYRVELAELEEALLSHSQIASAKAEARGDEVTSRQLYAWVIPVDGSKLTPKEVISFLSSKIPSYMIPAGIGILKAFPLDKNGKTNVSSLPLPATVENAKISPVATRTEKTLKQIWSDLLGTHDIGRESNWFQLGGHSLLALQLFSRIHQELKILAPLSLLLDAPTLADLAALLERYEDHASPGVLVALSDGGDQPPLFCIHGGDGGILFYRNLTASLPDDLPMFAIESHDLSSPEHTHLTSIQDIAGSYIQEIQAQQPAGPYRLAGYSFGGVVAHEIACQLTSAGHKVDFLGLFDTYNLSEPYRYYSPLERLKVFWSQHQNLTIPARLAKLIRRMVDGIETHWHVKSGQRKVRGIHTTEPHSEQRRIQVREENLRAMQSHHPRLFQGRIVLFRATTSSDKIAWPEDYGWTNYAAEGVEVVRVVGRHLTIFDPENADSLGTELAARIPRSPTLLD
ncbi:amino acid adenylation domain-containing protein [Luteolibacter pohnpeiensis]|uniref:Amino acid adenylation domain-containing protein n=1 Tax=Luteolibacter pohnpeiensis TaxID=454153 RepID=A0A934VQH6_9BACT|nr:amino acid adenylation domain-containing protein [Luteolibacter pohnpeiensis]